MSKEQTPIEVDEFIEQQNLKLKSPMEGYVIPFSKLKSMLEQYAQSKIEEAINPAIEKMENWSRSMREGHNILLYRIEDEIERLEKLKQR